jgi:hypothetical protein
MGSHVTVAPQVHRFKPSLIWPAQRKKKVAKELEKERNQKLHGKVYFTVQPNGICS